MGLLDGLTEQPTTGMGGLFADPSTALFASLLGRGNFGQKLQAGLLQANQQQQQQKEQALKGLLYGAQIQNYQSEAAKRQADVAAAAEQAAAFKNAFPPGGQQGGEAPVQAPQEMAAGMPQAPVQGGTGLPFDISGLIRARVDPSKIQQIRELYQPKVARTVETIDPTTKERITQQLDEFGKPVGQGFGLYTAPVAVNQGNRTTFVDPTKATGTSLPMFQSPDSAASNATAMRGQNMTDARAREQISLGKTPAGYRQAANGGLEFIPGGPADPNAAKKAAPTEFQGKSAAYGARAQEADRILNDLGDSPNRFGINAKNALTGLGAIEAGANWILSPESQKADQAQRDFVNAVLRQESGAAIGKSEFDSARRQYFPQPGDGPEVIAQKKNNRALAVQGLVNNARPGAVATETSAAAPASNGMPAQDAIAAELARRRGGR